jgi:hypothetical protein
MNNKKTKQIYHNLGSIPWVPSIEHGMRDEIKSILHEYC